MNLQELLSLMLKDEIKEWRTSCTEQFARLINPVIA